MSISSDKLEIKSPFFGCLVDHCNSSCMKKTIEEVQEAPNKIIEAIQDVDIKVDIVNNNNNTNNNITNVKE